MLEEALADFDGTVLVVSHDRYFLDRICDQIIAFEDGGLFVQPGNYSYYLEKKKLRDAKAAAMASTDKTSAIVETVTAPKPPRTGKLSFNEQRELEGMESAILTAEARVEELERTLNDPEFHASRSQEAHDLVAELETTRAEVTRLYNRWQELTARSSGV
jgi:ABC transport system ATP-binding/permease protein